MWKFSYWVLPLISSIVWLAMLLAMLLTWVCDGKPVYPFEAQGQKIAYISDVGAGKLKPLFIAMGSTTVVILDLALIAERWLRHTGKLVRNTSTLQKALSTLSIITAIIGAAGFILLSIFDTEHHKRLHDVFLAVFIGGYIVSAIFTCWEYQRLGKHFREHSILRMSFWVKLAFILLEFALAVAFGVLNRTKHWNSAAIVEWVIALIYTFYVFSFFMDFIPVVSSRGTRTGQPGIEEAQSDAEEDGMVGRRHNGGMLSGDGGATNGYANGYTNGRSNGHRYKTSSNF